MTTPATTPAPILNLDDLDATRTVQFRGREYAMATYGSLSPMSTNRIQRIAAQIDEWRVRVLSEAEMQAFEQQLDAVIAELIPDLPAELRQGAMGLPLKTRIISFFFQDAAGTPERARVEALVGFIESALQELGEPTADHPAPVAHAVGILRAALGDGVGEAQAAAGPPDGITAS